MMSRMPLLLSATAAVLMTTGLVALTWCYGRVAGVLGGVSIKRINRTH